MLKRGPSSHWRFHRADRRPGAPLAGCGSGPTADTLPVLQVYDVTGKVLLRRRQAIDRWLDLFRAEGGRLAHHPSGVIGPDGTFSLATGGSGEGAPVGEYKVRIETVEAPTDRKNRKPIDSRLDTPTRIARASSITVRAETNQLEPIRLKP